MSAQGEANPLPCDQAMVNGFNFKIQMLELKIKML